MTPTPPPNFPDFEAVARGMDQAGLITLPTGWAVQLCEYVRALERERDLDRGGFW